jgi:serine protease AprX
MTSKLLIVLAILAAPTTWARNPKIQREVETGEETVRVIVRYRQAPGQDEEGRVKGRRGTVHHRLDLIRGHAIEVPASELESLAADPGVESIAADQPVFASLDVAAAAVNAAAAWNSNKIGSGVGVAIIDSGVGYNHPDLAGRVVYNQDFTGQNQAADQYGHGTHVAAAVAGSGAKSTGTGYTKTFKGIAPGVKIINLKALNSAGAGTDSTVIAAINKAVALKSTYNIRVINLSLGRPVTGSYKTDPLCLAVEAAWKAGIVVVVAAGNYGRDNNNGISGYGTITAPGNDPYVITVGAMKDMGTVSRSDDLIATYSSKGPSLYDHVAKPDLVAPGNKMRSASTPDKTGSGLWETYSTTQFPCSYYMTSCGLGIAQDYFELNGTSMAAPIVSGAAAILIGADSTLTPDQVKARLMKTAYKSFPASSSVAVGGTTYTSYYDIFTIGAGYVDIQAALNSSEKASGNAQSPTLSYNSSSDTGTLVYASGSAFQSSGTFSNAVVWGTVQFVYGTVVVWGTSSTWSNAVVWGTGGTSAFAVVWGTGTNGTVNPAAVVWGTTTPGSINPLISVLTKGE